MRNLIRVASTVTIGGALLLGVTGVASAADGPANLTGKGCPSSYTNSASYGSYKQTLTRTFIAGNGFRYGDYNVTFINPATGPQPAGTREYRCY
ncbi:hypothetical protein [Actinacidiphila alni]|uniref:Uncharacterized protein n=1 Tax=Actinacidiphila alni TaxID=380248 RepID=A0A1I1WS91_9ACTN|nr:hypothetical protein [Actinacidiphila alni]SFD98037.1 hypothetical protein SAMN05216251_10146 [Actinacidiphila alni]